ncbi:hypothetical protein BGW39_008185, partial [Mortierella sp. 14UC]
IQSTGSVSSYVSWSSQDPAFNSNTSPYTQQQHQQYQNLQQQQYNNNNNNNSQSPLSQAQQHRGLTPPQIGASLPKSANNSSGGSGGRYRSNSNNSNISSSTNTSTAMHHQQHYPSGHHQQQPQQHHYRSNTTSMSSNSDHDSHFNHNVSGPHPHHQQHHLSYSSQTSSSSHNSHSSYDPQQHQQHMYHQKLQQQQLQQQQKILDKQQQQQQQQHHQRASDSSFSGDISRVDSSVTARSDFSSASSRSNASAHQLQLLQQQQQQQQEAPRSSSRLHQRRREPTTTSATLDPSAAAAGGDKLDANGLPSLDDYEVMLEQIASPNLGPREVRSTTRRKEREPRETREPRPVVDRAARQARRQMEQQQQQQQQQQQPAAVEEPSIREKSFERKLKRRSSLPSKLKATPSMFAGLNRRSSGSNGGKSSSSLTESPTLRALVMDNGGPPPPPQQQQQQKGSGPHGDDFTAAANPSLQAFAHLPALQKKRYSWESEDVVPRMDLLSVTKNAPSNEAARLPSWHDHIDPDLNPQVNVNPTTPVVTPASVSAAPVQAPHKPALTTKSHLRLSHTEEPEEGIITLVPIVEEEPEPVEVPATASRRKNSNDFYHQQQQPPIPPPRSSTPVSRSRPSTPLGNIRPPPGPAPASATGSAPIPIPLARKVSPTSKKPKSGHIKASPGSSVNLMLQPFALGSSRPRAGSSSSNGSFTLDGIIAPPPPSSPLPSLPPPSASAPPSSSTYGSESMMVGLGIAHPHPAPVPRSRKASAGARDLIRPPPQLLLHNDSRITPMAPPSTPPELGRTAAATAAAVAAASAAAELKAQQEKHERELQLAVKQIQDEKEALLQATRERHDRSHTEMVGQLESYRVQLQIKEEEVLRIRGAEQETMEAFRRDLLLKEDEIHRIQVQQSELQSVRQQLEAKEEEVVRIKDTEQKEAGRFRELIQAKEEEILRIRSEQEEIQTARHSTQDSEKTKLGMEISKLTAMQAQLEADLREAQEEVQRLLRLVAEKERFAEEDKRAREAIVSKIESLEQTAHQSLDDQWNSHEITLSELDAQMRDLTAEKSRLEEANLKMEQELQAFEARSQQEEAQYRILQDSVQRLSSKMAQMESQHAEEVEHLQREHADALSHLANQHKLELETELEKLRATSEMDPRGCRHESETQFEQAKSKFGDAIAQDRQEMEARERALRDRIDTQSDRNDQLEEELFQLQRSQDAIVKEKEILARTNRSLERHVSMQHLQQQENVFKMEELERENARLREILADLDIAAALAARQQQQQQQTVEDESAKVATMAEMFAQQQRKWTEQVEQMARKVARAEEEARRVAEQNVDLQVALDLATQVHSAANAVEHPRHHLQQQSSQVSLSSPVLASISRPSTPPPTSGQSNGFMSPPLSA